MAEQQDKPILYNWLVAHDLLEFTRPLWQGGGWVIRDDGKLTFPGSTMAIDTPWRHVRTDWRMDCATWHRLVFDHISKKMPPGHRFVPSRCHQCFKVVVRPRTLRELFALEALQVRLDRPGKCGIELRESVHGLYGGYFYTVGLEEGLARYNEVRQAVDEDKHLGREVQVLLKRGCTEFEHEVGPSDQWQLSPEQLKLEELVERWVAKDDVLRTQPEYLIWRIHRRWIEHAYAHGDPTYAEFTGGAPLSPPYVTYHHLTPSGPPGPATAEGK